MILKFERKLFIFIKIILLTFVIEKNIAQTKLERNP